MPANPSKARVLIVDDDPNQTAMLRKLLELDGYDVTEASDATQALEKHRQSAYSLIISDLKLPDMSGITLFERVRERDSVTAFILTTAYATVQTATEAIKKGIFDYIQKPIDANDLLLTIDRAIRFAQLQDENRLLRAKIEETRIEDRIVYQSKIMSDLMDLVKTVARSEATVLLRGESGTGKELFASAIHAYSNRCLGPFVKVSCAAIPENLLEDELFGHERGAFTDATKPRKGKFELAAAGTIFLDEIGDMSPNLQVKILRVLQEREFERLGGSQVLFADVRLVAATNQPIEDLIEKGMFREDLYYRINVIPIHLPALRDRREDIMLLAAHFMRHFNEKNKKTFQAFSPEAREILLAYPWPGNVRELENAVERAVVIGVGDTLKPEHLPRHMQESSTPPLDVISRLFETNLTLDEIEREIIRKGLERTGWNQSQAARLLGLTRRTLQYRVDKYGLKKEMPLRAAHAGADGGENGPEAGRGVEAEAGPSEKEPAGPARR